MADFAIEQLTDRLGAIRGNSLSVIQLGDIHLPDYRNARMIDDKDKGFPDSLKKHIAPARISRVIRAIVRLIENNEPHRPNALLLGGDLTSKGCIAGYQECVNYLCESLRLDDPQFWNSDHIHVVPGNHDIDRPSIIPSADLFDKFEPIHESWNVKGLRVLANRKARHTKVDKLERRLDIFSVNSCLGCGSKNYLPSKIRDQLSDLLQNADFDIQAIQLDTPAFDEDALTFITDEIESLTKTTLPFVLSHHNILPQAEPRIELYTEAINAGLARSRLSQLDRPVIYCHGHLHKDPVEIVSSPKQRSGRLISISAPLLSDGFNLIEVQYSRSCVPIGCIINPYRLDDDGSVKNKGPLRIPLWGHRDHVSASSDDALSSVLNQINSEGRYFKNVMEEVKLDDGSKPNETNFTDNLLELEWAGLITIVNRDMEARLWQIFRNEP